MERSMWQAHFYMGYIKDSSALPFIYEYFFLFLLLVFITFIFPPIYSTLMCLVCSLYLFKHTQVFSTNKAFFKKVTIYNLHRIVKLLN